MSVRMIPYRNAKSLIYWSLVRGIVSEPSKLGRCGSIYRMIQYKCINSKDYSDRTVHRVSIDDRRLFSYYRKLLVRN